MGVYFPISPRKVPNWKKPNRTLNVTFRDPKAYSFITADVGFRPPTVKMMEMDRAMTTNVWNYNQPLYQRYSYERHHPPVHHHYIPHRHQTPDALTPMFKSSQPYCSINYTAQPPPSVAADSVPGAWKVVRGSTGSDRQWPTAVTGQVHLGRATDAAAAVAAAAQRGWSPYQEIGA